jgi:tetratricopeptide (TPR) repeat protein
MSSLPIRTAIACCFLMAASVECRAQEHHEHTGKAPEQLGKVAFANSCSAEVQPIFARGVALLHSFWWQEGKKAFQNALDQDPSCAIATWGIAAIDLGNPFASGPTPAQAQDAEAALARGRSIGAKTERERRYINAMASYYQQFAERSHAARMRSLADAFAVLATQFPGDDEAQIFAALYLVGTQDPSDKSFARTLQGAGILEAQFARHPDHPGVAHYLIHAYDYPPIADQGLKAAYRYAEIAPSAPHALHMPSHIFTRVGAWQESASTNERSAAVAAAENEPNDRLHAMDYMAYAYLQLARDADARRVANEAPQVAGFNPQARTGPYALAAIPARIAVERSAWREAAQLQPVATRFPFTTAMTNFARAVGAARSGDVIAAEGDVAELARIAEALKVAKDSYWATEVEVQRLGGAAWLAYAKGNFADGLKLMRAAADLEASSEKSAVSPGRLLPARELLGDMLLESGQPADALAEYEASLVRDSRRFRTLSGAGQAAARLGNRDRANHFYDQLLAMAGPSGKRPELDAARAYLASK